MEVFIDTDSDSESYTSSEEAGGSGRVPSEEPGTEEMLTAEEGSEGEEDQEDLQDTGALLSPAMSPGEGKWGGGASNCILNSCCIHPAF